MKKIVERYTAKTFTFRFCKNDIKLRLSHALFSSTKVDSGSLMLLKSLVQSKYSLPVKTILDCGCGVGTIGIALSKFYPHAELLMFDRDAMALEFSRFNARNNGLDAVEVFAHIWGAKDSAPIAYRQASLVVANIPAKIGNPVLEKILLQLALQAEELVAIVIVAELRHLVDKFIAEYKDIELLYRAGFGTYTVFHYKRNGGDPGAGFNLIAPNIYIRNKQFFKLLGQTYELCTVYNLADFDTISYRYLAVAECIKTTKHSSRKLLFYNPGQGHLLLFYLGLLQKRKDKIGHLELASRDLLQLSISKYNLENFAKELRLKLSPVASIDLLPTEEPYSLIIIDLEVVPQSIWLQELQQWMLQVSNNKSIIIIFGKARSIQSLYTHKFPGLAIVETYKHKNTACIKIQRSST